MSKSYMRDGEVVTLDDDEYDRRFPAPPPPEAPAPPAVCGDAIIGAIAAGDRGKVDPLLLARIAWRDDVPATNNKLVKIARALGTTPDALRQAGAAAS